MNMAARYKDTIVGLSTDVKGTDRIRVGSKFVETDTGDIYVYVNSGWVKENSGAAGPAGAKGETGPVGPKGDDCV